MVEWDKLNSSIDGRLVAIVPSAKFCHELPAGNCSSLQWSSMLFRATTPGAMANVCLSCTVMCSQSSTDISAA